MLRTASINQVNQADTNIYLVGNPQVTFFKSVYKRHSNFAIESFNIFPHIKYKVDKLQDTIIKCKIPQYGDLLGKIYLKIDIPPMKTTVEHGFKFNKHLGYSMIKKITLKINGSPIDIIDGEMLYILHSLHNKEEKLSMISTMINDRHTKDYVQDSDTSYIGDSKTFINKYFNSPIRTDDQTIYIPLQFYFTKYSNTFLPIFLLENKSIEVEIVM